MDTGNLFFICFVCSILGLAGMVVFSEYMIRCNDWWYYYDFIINAH